MNKVLQRSGSIGGSRTLFVDSKSALFQAGPNSPSPKKTPQNLQNMPSFANLDDPGQTLDYKVLKKNSNLSRTLA